MKDKLNSKEKKFNITTIVCALLFYYFFHRPYPKRLYAAAVAGFIEPFHEIAAAFERKQG